MGLDRRCAGRQCEYLARLGCSPGIEKPFHSGLTTFSTRLACVDRPRRSGKTIPTTCSRQSACRGSRFFRPPPPMASFRRSLLQVHTKWQVRAVASPCSQQTTSPLSLPTLAFASNDSWTCTSSKLFMIPTLKFLLVDPHRRRLPLLRRSPSLRRATIRTSNRASARPNRFTRQTNRGGSCGFWNIRACS